MFPPLLFAPSSGTRSEGLDVLRFICAFWVLLAHLIPWPSFTHGPEAVPTWLQTCSQALVQILQPAGETHPAVLGFIVLSGYCIHRNGFRSTYFNLSSYAVRRAFRILPVFVLATAVGALCYVLATHTNEAIGRLLSGTQLLSSGLIAGKLLGVSAWVPALHYNTFQGNAPLHTVMVEIWLYAIYPLIVLLLRRGSSERSIWVGLFGIWVIGIFACTMLPHWVGWWHNGSLIGFLIYWWVGAKFVGVQELRELRHPIAWIGAVYAILTAILYTKFTTALIVVELKKLAFAILVGALIVAVDRSKSWVPGWSARIGQAGYSLYAFHAPVLYTLLILGVVWWQVLVCAVAVGLLMFQYFESRMNKFGRGVSQRFS